MLSNSQRNLDTLSPFCQNPSDSRVKKITVKLINNSIDNSAKPMTRRDFVRKSAFSTGSVTMAGLVLAHGEALANPMTTMSTTIGPTTGLVKCNPIGNSFSGEVSCTFEFNDYKAKIEYQSDPAAGQDASLVKIKARIQAWRTVLIGEPDVLTSEWLILEGRLSSAGAFTWDYPGERKVSLMVAKKFNYPTSAADLVAILDLSSDTTPLAAVDAKVFSGAIKIFTNTYYYSQTPPSGGESYYENPPDGGDFYIHNSGPSAIGNIINGQFSVFKS